MSNKTPIKLSPEEFNPCSSNAGTRDVQPIFMLLIGLDKYVCSQLMSFIYVESEAPVKTLYNHGIVLFAYYFNSDIR